MLLDDAAAELLAPLPGALQKLFAGDVRLGLAFLGELFDACGAERLDVCKYGVREGYLIDRMLR